MTIAPSLGYVGVAKESTPGTPVAATAFIPIRQNRVWQDNIIQVADDAMRGSAYDGPFDQQQGPISSSYDANGPAFADTLPWWLFGILGDVASTAYRSVADAVTNGTTTVTSATAAFTQKDIGKPVLAGADFSAGTYIVSITSATSIVISAVALTTGSSKTLGIGVSTLVGHSGSLLNTSPAAQPTSLTVSDYYGLTGTHTRQFPGCKVEELTLKFSAEGLLEYTVKLQGWQSALAAQPTNVVGAVTPELGYQLIPWIGATKNLVLMAGEVTLKRVTKPLFAVGASTPYAIQVGGLQVMGKASLIAEDDTEYLRYINADKPVVQLRFGHGTTTSTTVIDLLMSKCNINNGQPNHAGDFMAWDMDFQALPNATDAGASGGVSPIRANVLNAIASGTYQ